MTGLELIAYLRRRLAEEGLDMGEAREPELYDYLTEGRDQLKLALALSAPIAVKEKLTLELDPGDAQLWNFPEAAPDPLRILAVTDSDTGEELSPSSQLNEDDGEYALDNVRALRLADHADVHGSVRLDVVLAGAPITAATTSAEVGLPTPCHRAIGKWAAVLALTANEESDATTATGLLQKDLETLENLYGSFDANEGLALRHALMRSIGNQFGDTL